MSNNPKHFPHIALNLATEGTLDRSRGGGKKNTQTARNLGDRQGHGTKIRDLVLSVVDDWQTTQEQREGENKPELPNAVPLILKIDPDTFDLDNLRSSDIEIIAELEDGYIIGASGDVELSELQNKIEKFFQEERGGGVIAKILDISQPHQRLEFILSPTLLENWDKIRDPQIYIVDVGISCLGTKAKLSDYPKKRESQSSEQYRDAIIRWTAKQSKTYEEWDDLASDRQEKLAQFIQHYNGEFLSSFIDGKTPKFSQAPDSFSCRIQISGQGLKDLVSNFPYIFEVTEPDIIQVETNAQLENGDDIFFELESPNANAPKVCVIDSGIQEHHPILANAIDSTQSRSWVTDNLTADLVGNGGHGTRVAGAMLYPRNIPKQGKYNAVFWIQNARILDNNCRLSDRLYPPLLLEEIVNIYNNQTNTRLFNHSITGDVPCWTKNMSTWAETIDKLTWEKDILFIVAAGNIPLNNHRLPSRLSIKAHLEANRSYPNYLLENSCRIANPAQSFQALTVGSVNHNFYNDSSWVSIGAKEHPSAFSCSGLGIWDTIKPEVVEYGGDLVRDHNNPMTIKCSPKTPQLVRSTLNQNAAPPVAADDFGTSFAAPKVTHIAAQLAAEFPDENCLLYRALIVQSARWPEWTINQRNEEKENIIRQIGYGIPDLNRAIANSNHRVTLITTGNNVIRAKQVKIYQVKLPESLLSTGDEIEFLVEITLSYKAQPRRTRRNKRRYLSTWLDWECSKQGENPESFKERILKGYQSSSEVEKGEGLFTWTLGKQKHHKTLKTVSRSNGTLQKDWAIVKSYNLRDSFCIAVIGHEGWNNDPFASVPYHLVVSFESLNNKIPIYTEISNVQIELETEIEI
ncbi:MULTISPECIES: S8 family peptidase [Spirulina sp. CCY15215]|uniref:S8 family peptidase n=1 Tax=Spirulina sp. CCY15215 TaxID=2767591 RepID=UPI001951554D|nr:S8 family peptidase [Spirulina major]